MKIEDLLGITISIILTFLLLKLKIKYFKIIDKPNNRSSHEFDKQTGGGISFGLGSILSLMIFGNIKILSLLPLIISGYLDDRHDISRRIRYSVQVLTVLIILFFSKKELFLSISQISILLILCWVIFSTSIINFINFMDGIDGLVATNLILIILSTYIYETHSYLPVASSLLIFLKWNWEPSKIFMGDAGSTFLGGIILLLIVDNFTVEKLLFIMAISSPLLLDSSLTLISRVIKKENIFNPHKKHLFQRLNLSGFSHKKITLIYSSCSIINLLMYELINIQGVLLSMTITISIGFYLNKKYATKS